MSEEENDNEIKVRDKRVHEQQASDTSHEKFFEHRPNFGSVGDDGVYRGKALSEEDAFSAAVREANQEGRRHVALQRLNDTAVLERVKPGGSPNIEYIEFEDWQKLQQDFKKATEVDKMSINDAANAVGFMPFSVYGTKFKLKKDNKTWFPRPPLVHEVGVRPTGKIVLLKDKMPGDVGTVVVGAHTKFNTGGEGSE